MSVLYKKTRTVLPLYDTTQRANTTYDSRERSNTIYDSRSFGIKALYELAAEPGLRTLDIHEGAEAAYSLRLLKSDYIGPAIKVRRSSDDAEADIYFANGNLDTDKLLAFVGSNDGFVVTWYDQSGNDYDVTRATAANQPQIVSSGLVFADNGYPAIQFTGADKQLTSSKTITLGSQDVTSFAVYSSSDSSTQIVWMIGDDAAGQRRANLIWNGGAGMTYYHYVSLHTSNNLQIAENTGNQSIVYSLVDAGTDTAYGSLNGGTIQSGVLTVNDSTAYPVRIGKDTGTQPFVGLMQELILFIENRESDVEEIVSNINGYYQTY